MIFDFFTTYFVNNEIQALDVGNCTVILQLKFQTWNSIHITRSIS